ncbi:MAG: PulJ/GspJ family protein [Elusimicrobiota bacterium]
MKRKRGFSLTEILIVLAVSSIVLAIVAVVSSMTFKTSSQLNATMTLDEEITKLHTNMRYIVSQSWISLSEIENSTRTEMYIELNLSLPNENFKTWDTTITTIAYLPMEKKVIHYYYNRVGDISDQTISNYVDDFSFELFEDYIIYDATFTYFYDEEKTKPFTSKYTSGAVRFY